MRIVCCTLTWVSSNVYGNIYIFNTAIAFSETITDPTKNRGFGLGRKAFAIYVGTSMSRNSVPRMRSYIFPSGRYILIPRVSSDQHAPGPTYRDLGLDDYAHPSYYGLKVHYDPE